MKVCVYGLSHLGSVTAACLAEHFKTIGCDPNKEIVASMQTGNPQVFEPQLTEIVRKGLASGNLSFTSDIKFAVSNTDIVWVAFDTPLNKQGVADVSYIAQQVANLFSYLRDGMLLIISSQVPIGFTTKIEKEFRQSHPSRQVTFAYLPENLRLGKAVEVFSHPERIAVGIRTQEDQRNFIPLLAPFCDRIEWMSIESAEMVKHALNAFLATSISFINEIAVLCERVGADAHDVSKALRSDARIGPKSYLYPGGNFSGGTLDRDVTFLNQASSEVGVPSYLLKAIQLSNNAHKEWLRRILQKILIKLAGKKVSVLGLTYKPDTNSLQNSGAIELCYWLAKEKIQVQAYDPAVNQLPQELNCGIRLCQSMNEALKQTDAVIVMTKWPIFQTLSANEILNQMNAPIVLDPNQFLLDTLGSDHRIQYFTVGRSSKIL